MRLEIPDPLATNLRQHLLRSVGADFSVAALSYAVGIDVPPQMKESVSALFEIRKTTKKNFDLL